MRAAAATVKYNTAAAYGHAHTAPRRLFVILLLLLRAECTVAAVGRTRAAGERFFFTIYTHEIDKTESLKHFTATMTVGPRRILLSTRQSFVKQ